MLAILTLRLFVKVKLLITTVKKHYFHLVTRKATGYNFLEILRHINHCGLHSFAFLGHLELLECHLRNYFALRDGFFKGFCLICPWNIPNYHTISLRDLLVTFACFFRSIVKKLPIFHSREVYNMEILAIKNPYSL